MATATIFGPVNQTRHAAHRTRLSLVPAELLAIFQVARRRRTRDWCMILMAYRHGLRSAEVCGLKLADVKAGAMSVQRLQGSLKTIQPLRRHYGEPLLDEIAALRAWLKERRPDPSDALFTSQKGGALHPTQFFRIFQATATAAGLPPYKRHPRILRHSLASHLLARKVDVALVSQALGHRSINSTLAYVRFSDQQAADAAQSVLLRLY
jgi:type 1 fimbriae regulatory protein FimE